MNLEAAMNNEGENPEQIVERLRWDVDQKVITPFGEHVWLKECIHEGKRIGITDCCMVDNPCERHAAMQKAEDQAERN